MDSKREILNKFIQNGYVKHAPSGSNYTLKSGQTSNIYVDLRQLGVNPDLKWAVTQLMAMMIAGKKSKEIDFVAGLPLGGVALASDVSHHTKIPFLLIRKQPKDHGMSKIVELGTGSTVRDTIANIKSSGLGLDVTGVLCVVNRCESDTVPETSIPIFSLFSLSDLVKPTGRIAFKDRNATSSFAQKLFFVMDEKRSNVCFSADLEDGTRLLSVFEQIVDSIVAIKIHFDAVKNLDLKRLFEIAHKYDILVIGDRKFADIGSTVAKQLSCHPAAQLPHMMDACTIHAISGREGISHLSRNEIDPILIVEMSNSGNTLDLERTKQTALDNSTFLGGIVCQDRAHCEMGDKLVYLTPGVHLSKVSDGADQNYRDCHKAIVEQKNDIVIVGRGIYEADDPAAAARSYREAAWKAYEISLEK